MHACQRPVSQKHPHSRRLMAVPVVLGALLIAVLAMQCGGMDRNLSRVSEFNHDWKFMMGEQDSSLAVTLGTFDDSGWEPVRLPHDWAITGPFDSAGNGSTGKLPWRGVGWYRKTFTLDRQDAGKQVYIDFDGVMAFPKVYINGELAGGWDYGYIPFRVDATPYVKFGGENVISVMVDTQLHRSRWYPGAGIYRNVDITICDPVHIAHWGTFVTTPEITDTAATVRVQTEMQNDSDTATPVTVEVSVVDPNGVVVATGSANGTVPAMGTANLDQSVTVTNPVLWDVDNPAMYTVNSTVLKGDTVIETDSNPLGFRTYEFTADDGMYLNGRRVQLYGVCLHHDLGALGSAFNVRAMERELKIMMDMGVNAIRTSHNPPAREVLDLCDRMGLIVWDECFDKWEATADHVTDEPLETFSKRQLVNMVMRDRNHPSVFLWSIGNEIGTQNPEREGWGKTAERVKFMSDYVREVDPTRPVTMANDNYNDGANDVMNALDVVGYNYGRRYGLYRESHPTMPLLYSESASTISTRGYYEFPLPTVKTQRNQAATQITSYDYNSPGYSDISDRDFHLLIQDSFMAGEFVWTGFDYLGEPSVRSARSSYYGIVDLAGIPKDRFYLYQSYWRPDFNSVHILPHWNWPERVGENVPVFVYTNGDSAELFLNGRSLGMRTKTTQADMDSTDYYSVTDQFRLRWLEVTYEPGELRAVAYKNGQQIGEAVMQTAGDPARIRLTPEKTVIDGDGIDLSYILVEALDSNGVLCPLAENMINFTVTGPAEIAGVDNGNPQSLEPFKADYRLLFYGKAMLLVRSLEGGSGTVTITAASDGLQSASTTVTVAPAGM